MMQRRGFLKALAALPFVGLLFGKEKLPDKPKLVCGLDLASSDGDHQSIVLVEYGYESDGHYPPEILQDSRVTSNWIAVGKWEIAGIECP